MVFSLLMQTRTFRQHIYNNCTITIKSEIKLANRTAFNRVLVGISVSSKNA